MSDISLPREVVQAAKDALEMFIDDADSADAPWLVAIADLKASLALPPLLPPTEREREAFEAWASELRFDMRPSILSGWYARDETNCAWKAWQARASLTVEPAPKPEIEQPKSFHSASALRQPDQGAWRDAALARATVLHEKAGMPWNEADRLALSEAGITDDNIANLLDDFPSSLGLHDGASIVDWDDMMALARHCIIYGGRDPDYWEPLSAAPSTGSAAPTGKDKTGGAG